MDAYKEELFGPVLAVIRVDTLDEAIGVNNANPYGNGTALFTGSGEAARRFQRNVKVGMIGVNMPMSYYSFGDRKLPHRRLPHPRPRGYPLLHPAQGRHHTLAAARTTGDRRLQLPHIQLNFPRVP